MAIINGHKNGDTNGKQHVAYYKSFNTNNNSPCYTDKASKGKSIETV